MLIGPKIWELVPPDIRNLKADAAFERPFKNGNWKTVLVDNSRLTYPKLVLFSCKLWHTKNYRNNLVFHMFLISEFYTQLFIP